MKNIDAAQVLEDLLNSDLATKRALQGGLKPEEKKALRQAIKILLSVDFSLTMLLQASK